MDHPVACFSRKLLPKEKIWKEYLAIKLGVEVFAVYLIGRDYQALQWLSKSQNLNSQLTRWSIALQPFKFKGAPPKRIRKCLYRCPLLDPNSHQGARFPSRRVWENKGQNKQACWQPYKDTNSWNCTQNIVFNINDVTCILACSCTFAINRAVFNVLCIIFLFYLCWINGCC